MDDGGRSSSATFASASGSASPSPSPSPSPLMAVTASGRRSRPPLGSGSGMRPPLPHQQVRWQQQAGGMMQMQGDGEDMLLMTAAVQQALVSGGRMDGAMSGSGGGAMVLAQRRRLSGSAAGGGGAVARAQGLASLPRRVGATLKRKFWDSNELVSATAVQARDILATLYVNGRESTVQLLRHGSHRTVAIYGYARERAATTRLPWPFVPLRDGLILPCFRAVEASTQWLLSDRPGHYYNEVKRLIPVLPLGSTIILPAVYFAEGLAHVTLLVVQAPLPSAERVASAVELAMDMSKRGLGTVARECYYYVQLVDYHVTRTLARAQWEILGFGPYASLPRERRMEVMERMVDRYLSMAHPLRRYEFMSQIKWQNSQLHDDLIGSEIIIQRGGAMVEEDTWLDADASYRHHLLPSSQQQQQPRLLLTQAGEPSTATGPESSSESGLAMVGGDVQPIWFRWDEETKAWEPFHPHECRRLERAYRRHLKGGTTGSGNGGSQGPGQGQGQGRDGRVMSWGEASAMDSDAPGMGMGPGMGLEAGWRGGGWGTTSHYSGGESSDHPMAGGGAGTGAGVGAGGVVTEDSSPFSPEHAGPLLQHEVGPDDVFVDQGRYVVNLRRMVRLPVFWGFVGEGEPVRRGVWMHDTKQGFVPYPPRAALLLEDAYQYLQWYLANKPSPPKRPASSTAASTTPAAAPRRPKRPPQRPRARKQSQQGLEGKEPEDEDDEEDEMDVDAGGVLLTVQVDGIDGDQLVQFRSLQDIWAVRKTWVGALSLFSRRRVLRGAGPYRQPAQPAPKPQPQEAAAAEEEAATISSSPNEAPAVTAGPGAAAAGAAAVAQWHHRRLESSSSSSNLRKSRSWVDVTLAPPGEIVGAQAGEGGSANAGASGGIPLLNAPLEQWPVPSEEEDDFDLEEPVKHLVLVVHGIGQAMKRVELGVTQLKSIVECCDTMRSNTEEIDLQQPPQPPQQQQGVTEKEGAAADDPATPSGSASAPGVSGRVEYIPVEWHTKFRDRAGESEEMGQAGHLRLRDITLSRIPHLRSFVNDALLDVLYFMSPAYHQVILDEVAAEMNRIVSLFRQHCRHFSGKVSIAAHSLGGVICFDLLANQESVVEFAEVKARESSDPRRQHLKYVYTSYPRLDFGVSNLFALGSPIAVFLLVRRQHQALHHDFQLSRCLRLFNIFHPYDPVAYRLEPFIASRAYDPEADILPTWTGKLRVHYQVKKMVNRFWERLWEMKASVEDGVERTLEAVGLLEPPPSALHNHQVAAAHAAAVAAALAGEGEGSSGGAGSEGGGSTTPLEAYMRERMAATLRPSSVSASGTRAEEACYDADGDGEEDDEEGEGDEEDEGSMWPALEAEGGEGESEAAWRFRKYGRLNWGDRIDYSLQEKEIEVANEYIFAIGAHVLYWGSKDLCNFIVKHVNRDAEPEEAEAWRAMMQANGLPTELASANKSPSSSAAAAAAAAARRASALSASASLGAAAAAARVAAAEAGGAGGAKKGAAEIPEAVKVTMTS